MFLHSEQRAIRNDPKSSARGLPGRNGDFFFMIFFSFLSSFSGPSCSFSCSASGGAGRSRGVSGRSGPCPCVAQVLVRLASLGCAATGIEDSPLFSKAC